MGQPFEWPSIPDVVVDTKGRYVIATHSSKVWVTCLSPSLEVVWSCRDLTFDSDEARLAPMPDGSVLAWQPGRHSAVILDEHGKQTGKLGGREKPDAKVPFLEFTDAKDVICDPDGTLLVVVSNRLQRFQTDGTGIHTWPQTGMRSMFHNKLEPLYNHRSETDRSTNDYEHPPSSWFWGRRPLAVYDESVRGIFAGGSLYLLSEYGSDENAIGKFARDGRCLWSKRVPRLRKKRPGVDAAGNVYAINNIDNRYRLQQVSADGKTVRIFGDDWREGGPVHDPDHVTVLPDGTIGLWDSYSELTLLAPDGTVKYVSPKQQQEIDGDRARRQKKIDNDEEVD